MALSFPSSPTVGQTSVQNGRTFQWDGTVWNLVANVPGHASSHASGGSDAVTLDASQIGTGTLATARLGSGSAAATTFLRGDATWSVPALNEVAAYLQQQTSTVDVFPRGECASNAIAPASGTVYFAFFTPTQAITVSQITICTGAVAASGLTLARMGLYSFNETTATLLARTASDTTLFAATQTAYTRSFNTTGGYPATYTLAAGTRYGVAVVCTGTTMPQYIGRQLIVGVGSLSPRTNAQLGSQTDLPASTTVSSVQGNIFARLS